MLIFVSATSHAGAHVPTAAATSPSGRRRFRLIGGLFPIGLLVPVGISAGGAYITGKGIPTAPAPVVATATAAMAAAMVASALVTRALIVAAVLHPVTDVVPGFLVQLALFGGCERPGAVSDVDSIEKGFPIVGMI